MLARLQAFFKERLDPGRTDLDPGHRHKLAAAALLVEIARADFDFDGDEQGVIEAALRDTLDLGEDEIAELVQLAAEESEAATSLHQFTRLINETHTLDEKKSLMRQLWRVAYADGRIDRYEEQLLRRIAELVHLRHAEFMQCKHAAQEASQSG